MYFVCCKILGVNPGADEDTIRTAYRKSAKELHPDINNSEKAHEYFLILKNAYEYLLQHPYSEADIRYLRQQELLKRRTVQTQRDNRPRHYVQRKKTEGFTLKEILKVSRMARVIYLAFHLLFLFVGIWLVYHSVYDILFQDLDDRTNIFSAYFTIIFGFFFGLILTTTFLVTGISYLRGR